MEFTLKTSLQRHDQSEDRTIAIKIAITRRIRGWHLSRSMEVSLTITALRKGLEQHQPEIHHSDQGVQYAANEYVEILKGVGARMSMAAVGEAW